MLYKNKYQSKRETHLDLFLLREKFNLDRISMMKKIVLQIMKKIKEPIKINQGTKNLKKLKIAMMNFLMTRLKRKRSFNHKKKCWILRKNM